MMQDYKTRFINDDVKLKCGGRLAVKIEDEELESMMLKAAKKHADGELDDAETPLGDEDLYYVVQALHNYVVDKDNKFEVDGENVIVPGMDDYDNSAKQEIGKSLLGFHTLQNGLTFFGYLAGGDWESPVFMIIYYDGKKLRGYTPSYGNAVNLDCKCAIGNEGCELYDVPKFRKKYGAYKAWKEPEDAWDTTHILKNCYMEMYGISSDDNIVLNFNAIKEDIMARIEVI